MEAVPVNVGDIQAGDMFIKGGSPGHCVMVADVAEQAQPLFSGWAICRPGISDRENPLHEDDPGTMLRN